MEGFNQEEGPPSFQAQFTYTDSYYMKKSKTGGSKPVALPKRAPFRPPAPKVIVYVRASAHVRMYYIQVYAHMNTCMHAYIRTYIHTHKHTCMHVYTITSTHACIEHIRMNTYVYTCTPAHARTQHSAFF